MLANRNIIVSRDAFRQDIAEKPKEGAMKPNFYQILGVKQNASQSALDAAYTELLTKYQALHDNGGKDTANDRVILKWAYDHLSNIENRAAYDMKLEGMPVKPRIVQPIPKVLSQSATAGQQEENEEAQTDMSPAQLDEVNQSSKEKHWSELEKNSVTEYGVFIVGGGTHLTPEQYGLMAVKSAIDDTIKDAGKIVGNNETEFRKAIAAKTGAVHLHLIGLQTAVLFVYAAKFLAVPEDILIEIYQGIISGFNKCLINDDGRQAKVLEAIFQLYCRSLTDEFNGMSKQPEDIGFNYQS